MKASFLAVEPNALMACVTSDSSADCLAAKELLYAQQVILKGRYDARYLHFQPGPWRRCRTERHCAQTTKPSWAAPFTPAGTSASQNKGEREREKIKGGKKKGESKAKEEKDIESKRRKEK